MIGNVFKVARIGGRRHQGSSSDSQPFASEQFPLWGNIAQRNQPPAEPPQRVREVPWCGVRRLVPTLKMLPLWIICGTHHACLNPSRRYFCISSSPQLTGARFSGIRHCGSSYSDTSAALPKSTDAIAMRWAVFRTMCISFVRCRVRSRFRPCCES